MRLLGIAGMIALAVMIIGAAGAGAKPVSVKKVDLSTRTAVAKYLHSIGVSPKGVVIQRGRFNYAGPNCPGKKWTCTTSHRVVQVAADEGDNSFSCVGNMASPPDCVIVQSSAKKNKATCREHIQTSDPTASEHCSIDQTGPNNQATVDMLIVMNGSPSQSATQSDQVNQQNNDSTVNADNESEVNVRIVQHTGVGEGSSEAYSAAADTTSQNQQTRQDTSVNQLDAGAGSNESDVSSTFLQVAKAAADTTSQTQNTSSSPNNNVDVFQNNNNGTADSELDIDGHSIALGPGGGNGDHGAAADTTPLQQTQGSPNGGLRGNSNQSSQGGDYALTRPGRQKPGKLTLDATINENMLASGPAGTIQEQHGPTICCSNQLGNPNKDGEKIRETINLQTSNGSAEQTDFNELDCNSDNLANGCDGRIRANVNGAVGTASCAGNDSPCEIVVSCSSITSEGACVPVACDNIATEGGCPNVCDLDPSACDLSSPKQNGAAYSKRE